MKWNPELEENITDKAWLTFAMIQLANWGTHPVYVILVGMWVGYWGSGQEAAKRKTAIAMLAIFALTYLFKGHGFLAVTAAMAGLMAFFPDFWRQLLRMRYLA
jgi:hypothetical protein